MSAWLLVWLLVGLATTAALVACLIALVRQGLILGRTVRRVNDELAPLTDAIARESARAGERAASLRMPVRGRRRSRLG